MSTSLGSSNPRSRWAQWHQLDLKIILVLIFTDFLLIFAVIHPPNFSDSGPVRKCGGDVRAQVAYLSGGVPKVTLLSNKANAGWVVRTIPMIYYFF